MRSSHCFGRHIFSVNLYLYLRGRKIPGRSGASGGRGYKGGGGGLQRFGGGGGYDDYGGGHFNRRHRPNLVYLRQTQMLFECFKCGVGCHSLVLYVVMLS